MIAFGRILAPHNLRDSSETAMKYAMALARTFGEKLHLFSRLPPKTEPLR
jgi:hypothetical protein